MENKIDEAVEFLESNRPITIEGLGLLPNNPYGLNVSGWSNYINLKNITKAVALVELEELKSTFSKMVQASAKLSAFVSDRKVKYVLYYDDAGKTSVTICKEEDGKIEWGPYLQSHT